MLSTFIVVVNVWAFMVSSFTILPKSMASICAMVSARLFCSSVAVSDITAGTSCWIAAISAFTEVMVSAILHFTFIFTLSPRILAMLMYAVP